MINIIIVICGVSITVHSLPLHLLLVHLSGIMLRVTRYLLAFGVGQQNRRSVLKQSNHCAKRKN